MLPLSTSSSLIFHFFAIIFYTDGTPVSVSIPTSATLISKTFSNLAQMDKQRHLRNISCIDQRKSSSESNCPDNVLRRSESDHSAAKSPLFAAFLTPLSTSLSAVRHSMETGVVHCSSVVKKSADTAKKPMTLLSTMLGRAPKTAPPQASAIPAIETTLKDSAPCTHHVVHRKISIDARCVRPSRSACETLLELPPCPCFASEAAGRLPRHMQGGGRVPGRIGHRELPRLVRQGHRVHPSRLVSPPVPRLPRPPRPPRPDPCRNSVRHTPSLLPSPPDPFRSHPGRT